MKYFVVLERSAANQLNKIDKSVKLKILKKIKKLEEKNSSRHLKKGFPFFVAEVGQHRICFEVREKCKPMKKIIHFVGNHKEYEKWYSEK